LNSLARYIYTVRYLRPSQVVARAWFRLHRPRPDLRLAPSPRLMSGRYAAPVAPVPTLVGPDVFRFLNIERRCRAAGDWRPASASALWTYNLHYFDDLNARDATDRLSWHASLLERWIAENPPGSGVGWDPYPVSRRMVNWVKWAARGNLLSPACAASLAVQARWLTGRLEYHILGNHLLANAKALVHAGLYFRGAEAEQWLVRGLAIFESELPSQVLSDGGHFELSTMYHAAVLEDLLDLVNLQYAYGLKPPGQWLAAIERMRRWLNVMSHPDGDIAFFNDAAFGVAATPTDIEEYAARLNLPPPAEHGAPLVVLEASGYARAFAGPAYLICDCASVGPDYLPGHAHADTLSFELSIARCRVFVNSGTSQYGADAERQRQRGTAAHNTVVVDDQDSSEVWAAFRVARRARARLIAATSSSRSASVEASHDGYSRLPGRNTHWRRWTLDEHSLCIEDRVSGEFKRAEAYFHLHPAIEARACGPHEFILKSPAGLAARLVFDGAAATELLPSTWHPQFGMTLPNHCVSVRFSGASLATTMTWTQAQ
jgi:uncharacterized heparinase superfamily protein